MQSKRKNIKASYIAEFYFRAENETKVKLKRLVDPGEPNCWACGFYRNSDEIDYDFSNDGENAFECWNRAAKDFLEKCHIVPYAISQDDSLSNFVLLCSDCHKESPDTISIPAFQIWLDNKEYFGSDMDNTLREGLKAFKIFNLDVETVANIILEDDKKTLTPEFAKYYSENTVRHVGKKSITNPMTVAACITQYLEVLSEKSEEK